MLDLKKYQGFLLDMDGTFFIGDRLLDGALELLDFFREKGLKFTFLTNNTSKGRDEYLRKLAGFGVQPDDRRVFTAGDASISYIQQNYPGQRVYLMGTESLRADFNAAGISLDERQPDLLVIGYDTSLTYQKLCDFCGFANKGLPYIATHPDVNCPAPGGFIPDIGAMMALIEASTGRKADVIIGKPNRGMAEQAGKKLGLAIEQMLMVGDRLYTDIAMGASSGIGTVLVLSGETQRKDLAASPFVPDLVCQDLAELVRLLRESWD